MVVIMLNMLTMTMEHYGQTQTFSDTLNWINLTFIGVFTGECFMKLIGLRHYYFKIPWNVFDFVVVVLSVLGEWFHRASSFSMLSQSRHVKCIWNHNSNVLNQGSYLLDVHKSLYRCWVKLIMSSLHTVVHTQTKTHFVADNHGNIYMQ